MGFRITYRRKRYPVRSFEPVQLHRTLALLVLHRTLVNCQVHQSKAEFNTDNVIVSFLSKTLNWNPAHTLTHVQRHFILVA